MKETTGTIKAVCKNCGHEWKPRNPDADTSRRKCSKCQSENVELKTEPSHSEPEHEPTPDEISRIVNQKTPDNPREEKTTPDNPEQPDANAEPKHTHKIPTAIPLIALAAILGAGGLIYFHKRGTNRPKKHRRTPATENKPQEEPGTTTQKTRIIGL